MAALIARASLRRFRLPLRRPLATARGLVTEREGVLLSLTSASGACGYGEAMPLAGWPGGRISAAEAVLERALRSPEPMQLALPPIVRNALETALLDLAAREAGVRLAEALAQGPVHREVAVNALIDADEPAAVAEQARRAAERGFRVFKLKLTARALDQDLARVSALRDAIGADAALRLDAGGAWSECEAARALDALAPFAPEYVEEPAAGIEACARLRECSGVPIALDESACDAAGVERALCARAADVLVLKLPMLGGPSAARAAAQCARTAGVGVVFTSFLDSAIGVAAALHCAASLAEPPRACGLATGTLLARDLASLAPERGVLALPRGAGLGITPDLEGLA